MGEFDFLGLGGYNGQGTVQDVFRASAAGAAGVSLGEQRGIDTVFTDPVNSSGPINGNAGQFGGFFGTLNGVLGVVANTELARYAARRAYVDPATTPVAVSSEATAPAARRGPNLLLLGGGAVVVGLVVFLALRR